MTAAVMAVSSLAATAYSAYEANQAGKAEQEMYEAQARENQRQAELESIRAGQEQVNAEREAEQRYRQLSQDIGTTYATAAGNGVLLDSGSVTSIADANRLEANTDIDSLLSRKNLEIWGHNQNADAYQRQAGLNRFQGRMAKEAAGRKMVGAGLGAIGSTLSAFGSGMKLGGKINERYGTHVW